MKKKEIIFDDKEMNMFLREFHNESPRAAAIIGCAYLDNLLNELLKSRLVEDKALFKEIIDNLTFKRRIDLCYLTGIFSKVERDDLITINRIRRPFAHDISLNNFNKNDTPAKCNDLQIIKRLPKETQLKHLSKPREKYTLAVILYMMILEVMLKSGKRIDQPQKPW